jgi:hypothetical protein
MKGSAIGNFIFALDNTIIVGNETAVREIEIVNGKANLLTEVPASLGKIW